MNASFIKLLLFFSICCTLNGGEEGYRFINNLTETEIMDMEMITDYSVGPYNYISNFSGRIITESLDTKDGDYRLKQTWNNIISTDRRNDELKINHKAQKLNGTQFIITADSTGEFTREGIDDNAKEMEEQNTAFMFFTSQGNILHPFGSDSLRLKGDSWTVAANNHLEEFPGFENTDADVKDKVIFTFNKIKKKKGKMTAFISGKQTLEMKMTSQTWDEAWEMDVVGEFKLKAEFNLDDNKLTKFRLRGTISGTGIDLNDDSSISFNENMDLICKIKSK